MRSLPPLLILAACAGGEPDPARPPAPPDRYPRCAASPDEPLTPTLAHFVRWSAQISAMRAEVAPAIAGRAPVPSPAPPTATRLAALVRALTADGPRRPGSAAAARALDLAVEALVAAGGEATLRDRTIRVWGGSAALTLPEGVAVRAGPVAHAPQTAPGGVTGPLRYLGEGDLEAFVGREYPGEILVIELAYVRDDPDPSDPFGYGLSDPEGWLADHPGGPVPGLRANFPGRYYIDAIPDAGTNATVDVVARAARAGAAGVALLLRDHADPTALPIGPPDGEDRALPVLYVARADAERVREAARAAQQATLEVRGTSSHVAVRDAWVVLPGATDDTIVLSAHVDAPNAGFTEDAAGVAQLVAQFEAWAAAPVGERPYRLVAALTDGHHAGADGARQLALATPDVLQRAQAWISVGGLGAREARFDEAAGAWVPTGAAERSTLFVSHDAPLVTAVLSALADAAPPSTRVRSTAGLLPPSEVAGVLVASSGATPDLALRIDCGVPFVTWRTGAPWQLDDGDTRDTLDPGLQARYAAALTEIIARLMAAEPWVEAR